MPKERTIGSIIQMYRKKIGLTQEELALKSGILYTTLIKIEGGQVKNPTIKTVKKIAGALEVKVDELLNND